MASGDARPLPLFQQLTRRHPYMTMPLEEIGRFYLRWSSQDESGPSRAERNAALREGCRLRPIEWWKFR